ncbi:MAG: SDR family NAD(P)-dependent oxidoreductase [Sandaracinaceae bacterium]
MDLTGKRVVVTGANTGVGRATADALAARGAEVILACRSAARASDALRTIPGARFLHLDLADLASVRRAAVALEGTRVDVLINNAGVGGARGETAQGFELAFGVNHLGHALFTSLVRWERVVHLGSGSHEKARGLDFSALARPTRSLLGFREYAASKLAVMLFHHALVHRGRRSYVADPGDVASDAWRRVPWPARPLLTRSMKSPAEGALTPVFCAVSPNLPEGLYCDRRPRAPSTLAEDPALAEALWRRTQEWTR